MARRKHPAPTHFGITRKLVRQGKTVTGPDMAPKSFPSLRQARRYMRTGSPTRP